MYETIGNNEKKGDWILEVIYSSYDPTSCPLRGSKSLLSESLIEEESLRNDAVLTNDLYGSEQDNVNQILPLSQSETAFMKIYRSKKASSYISNYIPIVSIYSFRILL